MAFPWQRSLGSTVASAATVVNPTNLSPAPGTIAVGDLLVCVTTCRSRTATVATPSGWTLATGFPVASATTSGGKVYVFYKISASTNPVTETPALSWSGVTTGASGDSSMANVIAYQYAAASQAGTVTSTDAASTTTFTAPSITTTVDNALVLQIGMRVDDNVHTATWTNSREKLDSHTTTGTGHMRTVGIKVQQQAGASGLSTITPSLVTSARTLTASVAFAPTPSIQGDGTMGLPEEMVRRAKAAGEGAVWPLTTAGGTDQSGFGHDAVAGGGVTAGGYTTDHPFEGQTQATTFDGTDDVFAIDGTPGLYNTMFANGPRTYWGFMKVAGLATEQAIFGTGGSASTQPYFSIRTTGNIDYYPAGTGGASSVWTGAMLDRTARWLFWALVSDQAGSTATLYIDGTTIVANSVTFNLSGAANINPKIGARATSSLPFNGQMAHSGVVHALVPQVDLERTILPLAANPSIYAPATSGAGNLTLSYPVYLTGTGTYKYAVNATTQGGAGPTLNWPLDATDGATDQSNIGAPHNGTAANGVTVGGYSGSPIAGETTSTDFDGVDDLITATGYSPYVNGTVRSFVGWYNRDVAQSSAVFAADSDYGPNLRWPTTTNDLLWDPDNFVAAGSKTWSAAWPGQGTWNHLAVVFDEGGDLVSLYVNGVLNGGTSFASTQSYDVSPGPGNYQIGSRFGAPVQIPYDGKIAHVAVFERGLTGAEVTSLYQKAQRPPVAAGSLSSGGNVTITTVVPATLVLQTAGSTSNATAALTARNNLTLQTAGSTSDATVSITAKTGITLQIAASTSSAAATITAKTGIPLQTAGSTSNAALALTAKNTITLQTAPALSNATGFAGGLLVFTAPTQVPLQSAPAQSSATLALSTLAVTTIPLQAAPATSNATLAITAKTTIPLQTAGSTSDASATLTAKTAIPLQTAASTSGATATITAATAIPLQTAPATSNATAAISTLAVTTIPLQAAPATSNATATVKAQTAIPLQTAASTSNATATVKAQTYLPLQTAAALSSASLQVTAKTGIPLQTAPALSGASLQVTAKTGIPLQTAPGQTTATVGITVSGFMSLQSAGGQSTATAVLHVEKHIPLSTPSYMTIEDYRTRQGLGPAETGAVLQAATGSNALRRNRGNQGVEDYDSAADIDDSTGSLGVDG